MLEMTMLPERFSLIFVFLFPPNQTFLTVLFVLPAACTFYQQSVWLLFSGTHCMHSTVLCGTPVLINPAGSTCESEIQPVLQWLFGDMAIYLTWNCPARSPWSNLISSLHVRIQEWAIQPTQASTRSTHSLLGKLEVDTCGPWVCLLSEVW
jgi:hypothetical protein